LLKSELIEPLYRLFDTIRDKSSAIRELAYGFSLAHRYMSLHTLTGLEDRPDTAIRQNRVNLQEFEAADFANIIFSVNVEKIANLRFDSTFYHKAQSIHHLMSDVGDGIKIARKHMDPEIWQKKEILNEAMKFVGNHPLKSFVQEELVERRKIVPFKKFRPRRYLSEKLNAAESFFRAIPMELLGYTPSFIFTNGMSRGVISMKPTPRFRLLLKARKMGNLPTLDIFQTEELILKGKLGKYFEEHPGPIRFAIPIKLEKGAPSQETQFPFSMGGGATPKVDVTSLMVAFRDGDDEVRHFTDEFSMLKPRAYVSEVQPWKDIDSDFPRRKMVHTLLVWTELEFGVPLQYMQVRPGSIKHLV
jgi:hypothetical protein